MHWEILIIPLIALGVWVLGTLFKGGENDEAKKAGRRVAGSSGRSAGRRPVTDLDRFLEEARRRREAEERRRVPSPPPPAPRPVVARAPLRERPPQPPSRPPAARPARPVLRSEEQVPVAEAAVPEALPVEPVPTSPPPAAVRQAPLSPIAQQVRSLLSKPQTAATAFALREIFDRPLCKRRR